MRIAPDWKEYRVIATGDGEKLEKWGDITLLRPDPQVIWHAKTPLASYKGIDAIYERSRTGGGMWKYKRNVPSEFTISWRDLTFSLKLMGFKHTGLFPEQAVNWDRMMTLIKDADREISVLNLFGYTGAASVACLKAGAKVCHVDSAKAMVERAGENVRLSGLDNSGMRYIIDDCFKFCQREIRRGKKYDAIILNFANCDMVGHTGVLDAAVKAVETVDECMGKVYDAAKSMPDTVLCVTADHGNADCMLNPDGKINTAHTTNPVPFVVCCDGVKLRDSGRLSDIAPTMLDIMGIAQPAVMSGKTLIVK